MSSKVDGMASLISHTAQKRKIRKNTIKTRQRSVEAVRKEEVKLRWIGFVKEVGFKPGMKERGSYRCTLS